MKREIIALVLMALCLTGCAGANDPYRVDTVVYIPADPVDVPTEQIQPETEQATEIMTLVQTEPEATEQVPEATDQGNGNIRNRAGSHRSRKEDEFFREKAFFEQETLLQ